LIAIGTARPVYRDNKSRQFVLDDAGEPVYGVWLHPEVYQEPVMVELAANQGT
jgi:hypothetical protein